MWRDHPQTHRGRATPPIPSFPFSSYPLPGPFCCPAAALPARHALHDPLSSACAAPAACPALPATRHTLDRTLLPAVLLIWAPGKFFLAQLPLPCTPSLPLTLLHQSMHPPRGSAPPGRPGRRCTRGAADGAHRHRLGTASALLKEGSGGLLLQTAASRPPAHGLSGGVCWACHGNMEGLWGVPGPTAAL